jgi:hypothetical protein
LANVDLVNKVNKRMVLKMEEMTSSQQESAASKIEIEDVKKKKKQKKSKTMGN